MSHLHLQYYPPAVGAAVSRACSLCALSMVEISAAFQPKLRTVSIEEPAVQVLRLSSSHVGRGEGRGAAEKKTEEAMLSMVVVVVEEDAV